MVQESGLVKPPQMQDPMEASGQRSHRCQQFRASLRVEGHDYVDCGYRPKLVRGLLNKTAFFMIDYQIVWAKI